MFLEYEIVYSVKDLPGVPKNSSGTILIVLEPGVAYVVEFIDLESEKSLNILTVYENDIRRQIF